MTEYPKILAFRRKTGCRQYNFTNLEKCFKYFRKKCYYGEMLLIMEFDEKSRKKINEFWHLNEYTEPKK